MPRSDDDALSWAGDDEDPTLDVGESDSPDEAPPAADPRTRGDAPSAPEPPAGSGTPSAARPPEARPDDEEAAEGEQDAPVAEARRLGDIALVALGVLGGVYVLWAVGWVLGAMRLRDWIEVRTGAVADAMFLGSMGLAVLAPAIWFAGTWYLTRGRAGWARFVALLAGAVVLVPWPFVMVGVIGR